MKRKINPEVKAKWLEALRSKRYKQGQHCLAASPNYKLADKISADEYYYCCLGVLCEIAVAENVTERGLTDKTIIYGVGGLDSSATTLPPEVVSWAGVEERAGGKLNEIPEVMEYLKEHHPGFVSYAEAGDLKFSLVTLNDYGIPFESIADIIEIGFE